MEDPIRDYSEKSNKSLITIKTALTKKDLIIIYYMIICSENLEPYGAFNRIDLLENMRKNLKAYKEDLDFILNNGNSLLDDILCTDFKSLYKEFFEEI